MWLVVPAGGKDFSLLQVPSSGFWCILGFLLNGNRGSLPLVEQPQREVNHSPPPPAEIKNEWRYTSTPSIRLHGVDRDNFTFHFFFSAIVRSVLLSKSCRLFRCLFVVICTMNGTIGVCVVCFTNIKYWNFLCSNCYMCTVLLSLIPSVQCFFHQFQLLHVYSASFTNSSCYTCTVLLSLIPSVQCFFHQFHLLHVYSASFTNSNCYTCTVLLSLIPSVQCFFH